MKLEKWLYTDNDIKPETTLTEYDSIAKMTKKIASLEKELKHTKENLQTTIEELESSNEELQSTNEELQSINEEIETSKEELQSLNEELVISNTELQKRIEKIASVSDDISNLFNSTEVAAIFLNTHMHIKHFTPKAQNLIHIIQSDIGRPLRHFATNIKYDYLIENAEEVLNTLISKIITVQSKDNKYYSIKILPYRTLYNVIDGVVITFTDISIYKETEIKMKSVNDSLSHVLSYHETILDCLREPILVLNMDLEVMAANKSFYQYFHLSSETTLGQYVYDLAHKQWNMPKLRELLNNVVSNDILFENFKVEHEFPIIGKKKLILNARKIFHQYHGMDTLFLAMDEE